VTVLHNLEARSRDHCCSRKETIIKYYGYVCPYTCLGCLAFWLHRLRAVFYFLLWTVRL